MRTITILDQHDRIIYTTAADGFTPLQSLSEDPLVSASAQAEPSGIYRYVGRSPELGTRHASSRPR